MVDKWNHRPLEVVLPGLDEVATADLRWCACPVAVDRHDDTICLEWIIVAEREAVELHVRLFADVQLDKLQPVGIDRRDHRPLVCYETSRAVAAARG